MSKAKLLPGEELSRQDVKKGLILPSTITPELAELVGIQFGDGSMDCRYNYTYRITYTINLRDMACAKYIQDLFYDLFHEILSLTIFPEKNAISLVFYSKSVCKFLNEHLNVPYSPKKELRIPLWITSNPEFLRSFLKGLFDTDECVTIQRDGKYQYPLVKISNKSLKFCQEIR